MRAPATLLLGLAGACSPGPKLDSGGGYDSADSADSGRYTDDTHDTSDGDPDAWTGDWCADWEDGTLARLGYGDTDFVELMDGAIVANVEEGGDWSALRGESASLGQRARASSASFKG